MLAKGAESICRTLNTPYLEETSTGCRLRLYVQPGARKSAFAGLHGEDLKVAINAPPVDGQANERLRRFVAKCCGVPPSRVTLLHGCKSRRKVLLVEDLEASRRLRREFEAAGIHPAGGAPG